MLIKLYNLRLILFKDKAAKFMSVKKLLENLNKRIK